MWSLEFINLKGFKESEQNSITTKVFTNLNICTFIYIS